MPDGNPKTEKRLLEGKESNKIKIQRDESMRIKINATATLQLTHNPSQFAVAKLKEDALIRNEQQKDKNLKNLKQIQSQPCDELPYKQTSKQSTITRIQNA